MRPRLTQGNKPNTQERQAVGTHRFLGIILGVGLSLQLISCGGESPLIRTLADHPNRTIALEVTYREGDREYAHPVHVAPETLAQALNHIGVMPGTLLSRLTGGGSPQQDAFTEEENTFFSENISQALAKATPLETATFFWSTPRGNGIWEITSGGVFVHNDTLHIHLINYRQTIAAQEISLHMKQHPLISLGEPIHTLKATSPVRENPSDFSATFLSPATPSFLFTLQEDASTPTLQSSESLKGQSRHLDTERSTTQRLRLLENLRQEELLTEEEYQIKRKAILQGL